MRCSAFGIVALAILAACGTDPDQRRAEMLAYDAAAEDDAAQVVRIQHVIAARREGERWEFELTDGDCTRSVEVVLPDRAKVLARGQACKQRMTN